ncbi:MAG: hypothetical protein AABW73_01925 [Nanoarchaeota archaeon]
MTKLYLEIDTKLYNDLKNRAKKNYLEVEKLSEDIIRRSMITYKKNSISQTDKKVDDSLVNIFSRQNKGRKRK